jgi:biopolymer transport protein ExbD
MPWHVEIVTKKLFTGMNLMPFIQVCMFVLIYLILTQRSDPRDALW